MQRDFEVRRAVEVDQSAAGQNAEPMANPPRVSWQEAGAVFATAMIAAAAVRAVGVRAGDTVVVSHAGEGVGAMAVQLAVDADAIVIGLAEEGSHRWLVDHDVVPIAPGSGAEERIQAVSGGEVDAFIDAGGEDAAGLAARLGVAPHRIYTASYTASYSASYPAARTLFELAELIEDGVLEIPVLKISSVREAYGERDDGTHRRGARPGD
jgi:NADPH:quinone reductase-like Zn-dependent oxidoreductase